MGCRFRKLTITRIPTMTLTGKHRRPSDRIQPEELQVQWVGGCWCCLFVQRGWSGDVSSLVCCWCCGQHNHAAVPENITHTLLPCNCNRNRNCKRNHNNAAIATTPAPIYLCSETSIIYALKQAFRYYRSTILLKYSASESASNERIL
jgi:hypothetical protein